ncbi:MAG: copper amine oxidase N-terminal domain-containing protein, partial [Firmicutes bacterium]|nr:copper amine oxidase N-terminal domain-containing protein [Bacillota bacterium]
WIDTSTSTADSVYVEGAGSSYFELRLNGIGGASDVEFAEFDFSDAVSLLDIDDDFTGNLEVAVDVIGMGIENSKETILWTDNDEVTIAKVAGGDVDIVVGDAKKVSVGGDKEVADITLEESMAGAFSDNETITLEIEAEGVEFKTLDPDPSRLGVIDLGRSADEGEYIYYKVQITEPSQSLPGQLKFDEIMLDIAPDATGEIEISVTSDGDADLDETVTVGAVGGGDLTVTVDEDTGMEEYMRKASLDELWEITIETNGELSEGDKVYITLPDNFEFYEKALQLFDMMSDISKEVDYMNTFDGHQSVWLEVNANGDGEDEITVSNLWVAALPECQYGDIVVEIGGEIGQASAKVGFVKPAVTVKPEQTHISRGNNQLAGNITFTETDVDAVEDDMKLHIVLPNGVEFASTPTVTVNGEEIDGARIGPGKYDDDVCELTLDKARGSKIDTLVLSGIRYDIEHWFNPGEVIMVSLGGNDAEAGDNFNLLYESFMLGFFESLVKAGLESPNPAVAWNNYQFKEHADEKVLEVPNAIIIDPNEVTTSFAVGDEGVYVENGRTLVQVNLLSETLGLQKSWDADAKTAYFVKNGKVVAFPVGQNIINVNKAEITVDQGAKIINGFTCVTLRGLEMAFGGKLTWDNETKTAIFVFNK